jgi:hypothetical protein
MSSVRPTNAFLRRLEDGEPAPRVVKIGPDRVGDELPLSMIG